MSPVSMPFFIKWIVTPDGLLSKNDQKLGWYPLFQGNREICKLIMGVPQFSRSYLLIIFLYPKLIAKSKSLISFIGFLVWLTSQLYLIKWSINEKFHFCHIQGKVFFLGYLISLLFDISLFIPLVFAHIYYYIFYVEFDLLWDSIFKVL